MVLDTHALLWLLTDPDSMSDDSLVAIGEAQNVNKLFVSPITAWELSIAINKRTNAPNIGNVSVKDWYHAGVKEIGGRVVAIGPSIALASSDMIAHTGHRDPGDCYIIATAKYKKVPIVTRDGIIQNIASTGYVDVVVC